MLPNVEGHTANKSEERKKNKKTRQHSLNTWIRNEQIIRIHAKNIEKKQGKNTERDGHQPLVWAHSNPGDYLVFKTHKIAAAAAADVAVALAAA